MRLSTAAPLAQALTRLLDSGPSPPPFGEVLVEPLPSSRRVLRFTCPARGWAVVGKFFGAYPPRATADLSLAREYDHYRQLPALGLDNGRGLVPRLLGCWPATSLGLLLEAVPGPDLDHLLLRACVHGETEPLYRGLEQLARLLAFFHSRPRRAEPLEPGPALAYLDKVAAQLRTADTISPAEGRDLARQGALWEARWREFPGMQVLIHGDATPTNFLFPNGRAMALDMEKLRWGDRLWDLSWVAGEVKHAWGWRTGHFEGSEPAIGYFFRAYLGAGPPDPVLTRRLYALNPLYMALAELGIARNQYLSRDYRQELVAEARRCLHYGRRL
jgi:aminoglycoside phosphotransferase